LVRYNEGIPIIIQVVNSSNLSDVVIPLRLYSNQGKQLIFSIADMTVSASVNVYLDAALTSKLTLLNNSGYMISPTTTFSGTGRFFLRTSADALSIIENNLET
jgi:hypothetical protein